MNETTTENKPFSLLKKVFLILLLIILCFFVGYAIFYFNSFWRFLTASMNQHISVNAPIKTANFPNQTNILLLGSDNDQKFTGNPLTQTMLVVHIDYAKKEIDMFSIPRDLWVRMPGKQIYGKIDQASEENGIPSAIQVVEQTFGIRIDHYAWVGLYGFIKTIDALGGVNLQVVHPVLDNSYPTDINSSDPYGYQRLDIQPGLQHMTGEQALQYVRSRHEDLIGDFGRTQRQRQLILTMKDTLLSDKTSLLRLPDVFDSLTGQIKTDVSTTFGLQLGIFFLTNRNIVIKQLTLSPPTYATVGNSTDGQSIVIGDASASASLLSPIFGNDAGQTTLQSLSNLQGVQQ